ncbi:MAG: hypothetical protein ABI622_09340 [Chloroflexota bacterium]
MRSPSGPATVMGLALVLILIIGIPAAGLLNARPSRFGWQMYTVAYEAPRAWAKAANGSLEPIDDFVNRFAVLRGDVPSAAAVARAMCAFLDAGAVVVELRPDARGEAACP